MGFWIGWQDRRELIVLLFGNSRDPEYCGKNFEPIDARLLRRLCQPSLVDRATVSAAPTKKIETNTVFPGSLSDMASGGWIGC